MVDAVPTPEYGDKEYKNSFGKHLKQLEDEARRYHYQSHGLMIWNISGYGAASYPSCSLWDKIWGLNKEFKGNNENAMHYLTRISKSGLPSREEDHLYVSYKKIGLDFKIVDMVTETAEREKDFQFTILSLACIGWQEASSVPEGQIYSRPDILHFPESLIRWEDILKESYQKKGQRKKR